MKILVLGATGLLGQALIRVGELFGQEVVSLARKRATYCIDITDTSSLEEAIRDARPDVLVNAVAIVDSGNNYSNATISIFLLSSILSIK